VRFGRWVFAVLFVLVSCSRNDIAGPVPRVPDATGRIAFEISDRSLSDLAAGALEITLARIQTDTLVLDVRYGGGCADHAFVLVASSAFAESFPVQSFMRLSHDARGDLCKALVSRQLRADISLLRDAYRRSYGADHATIAIQLSGTSTLLYTF
jgi:hypothetical protein